jgi:hypothetical protein
MMGAEGGGRGEHIGIGIMQKLYVMTLKLQAHAI